jgi:hypothetical protein
MEELVRAIGDLLEHFLGVVLLALNPHLRAHLGDQLGDAMSEAIVTMALVVLGVLALLVTLFWLGLRACRMANSPQQPTSAPSGARG